jgi:hypothetical protein
MIENIPIKKLTLLQAYRILATLQDYWEITPMLIIKNSAKPIIEKIKSSVYEK